MDKRLTEFAETFHRLATQDKTAKTIVGDEAINRLRSAVLAIEKELGITVNSPDQGRSNR